MTQFEALTAADRGQIRLARQLSPEAREHAISVGQPERALMLEGSIATLGNEYVLSLRATRCGTGDPLVRPINCSVCCTRWADTICRNGDCSSCTARPCVNAWSKTGSLVSLLKSAITNVSVSVMPDDRCRDTYPATAPATTIAAAAIRMLCGVAIEQLDRWLASGAVHHSGLAALPQMVCLHSLLICLQNDSPA